MDSTSQASLQLTDLLDYVDSVVKCDTTEIREKSMEEQINYIAQNLSKIWEIDGPQIEHIYFFFLDILKSQGDELFTSVQDKNFSSIQHGSNKPRTQLHIDIGFRIKVFISILKIASDENLVDIVKPQLLTINKIIDSWNRPDNEYGEVYYYLSKLIPENWGAYTKKWILTFSKIEQENLSAILHELVKLINDEYYLIYEDIYESAAIRNLENKTIVETLRLLTCGGLDEFNEFIASKKAELEALNINTSVLLGKNKVLTLLTLTRKRDSISYKEIAKELKIYEQDVEQNILNAICKGVIIAKMDQLNQNLIINHVIERRTSIDSWKYLKNRLTIWNDNIQAMLKVFQ